MSHHFEHKNGVELEPDVAEMIEQLRSSREEMHYFVRALSHDLNANFMILDHCFGRLCKHVESEGSSTMRDQAEQVQACLRQSRRFLQDLVTLARTGAIDMRPELVSLREIIDEVADQQRDLLLDRGVQLEVAGWLPEVSCNRKRVHQVVTNLLRNAAKHGCAAADPRMKIYAAPGEEEGFTDIFFEDNGAGIPEEYQAIIFRPGQRIPNTRGDGSGMGLAIVDKIARYYGGAARVASPLDGGMAIVVTLPSAVVQHRRIDAPTMIGKPLAVAQDTPAEGGDKYADDDEAFKGMETSTAISEADFGASQGNDRRLAERPHDETPRPAFAQEKKSRGADMHKNQQGGTRSTRK